MKKSNDSGIESIGIFKTVKLFGVGMLNLGDGESSVEEGLGRGPPKDNRQPVQKIAQEDAPLTVMVGIPACPPRRRIKS